MAETNHKPGREREAWSEHKRKLKMQFPALTNSDLHFEPGRSDDMFRKVQFKIGKSKKEMAEIIALIIQNSKGDFTTL